jgi:hypothetical protein
MKKLNLTLIVLLLVFTMTQVNSYADTGVNATSSNQVSSSQNQTVQSMGFGGEGGQGGSAYSDSDSGAIANISTNSTSNYQTRTPPIAMFPPYLPTFSHGGWGTIQAYFPNGPNGNDKMYERAFYPGSKLDMKELKNVMNSLPYDGPLSMVGGIINCVGTIFGGPDNFHHGKGFEISNSVVRKRRPNDRPLYILIDSNINRDYFSKTGYVYVGKISLEGKVERNWDMVYKAAIAEALPWDVDILLISGGMKGVTVGTNLTFPAAGGAYSQANYSVSLLGGYATGMTEGKGVAMVSAECYRYYPQSARSRNIPEAFYERIHSKTETSARAEMSPKPEPSQNNIEIIPEIRHNIQSSTAAAENPTQVQPQTKAQAQVPQRQQYIGVHVSPQLYEMAGFNN